MVGVLVDVEEDGAGDVSGEVAGVGVDWGSYADRGKGGVEDDGVWVLKAGG